MSGNTGLTFRGCDPFSTRSGKRHGCYSGSQEFKSDFTGATGSTVSTSIHSNDNREKTVDCRNWSNPNTSVRTGGGAVIVFERKGTTTANTTLTPLPFGKQPASIIGLFDCGAAVSPMKNVSCHVAQIEFNNSSHGL
jgi:hypothetical protein